MTGIFHGNTQIVLENWNVLSYYDIFINICIIIFETRRELKLRNCLQREYDKSRIAICTNTIRRIDG